MKIPTTDCAAEIMDDIFSENEKKDVSYESKI
jgi:hypothetical protein